MIIINKLPDKEAVALSAEEQFITLAREAVGWRGTFYVALSGGSTPQPLYRKLAARGQSDRVEWEKVQFFWSDERCVPPDHPDSNYRMARELLLDPLDIPEENIHRMAGEDPPEQAARQYQALLREQFSSQPPRFDLILLGLGDDGHTASLFPQTKAVRMTDPDQWVAANFVPALGSWRLTFTPTLINAAANISFLVTGEEKQQRLHQVMTGRYQPTVLPAQIVNPRKGTLTWFVDQAAGELV